MSYAAIRHALSIALPVFSLCACKGDADFSGVMPTPVTLNADEYRGEITGIDRLVFDEKPFEETRRAALAGKLDELAKRVKASSDSRFITIEVLELKRLAEVAKSFSPDAPRTELCNQWMQSLRRSELVCAQCGGSRRIAATERPLTLGATGSRVRKGRLNVVRRNRGAQIPMRVTRPSRL